MLLLLALLFVTDTPPTPNPSQPIAYGAWLNQQFAVADDKNAAEHYADAVRGLEVDWELHDAIRDPDKWSSRNAASARIWLKQNRRAIEALEAGAALSRYHRALGPNHDFHKQVDAEFAQLRTLSFALHMRIMVRVEAEEYEAALADFETILTVGRHLQMQPELMHYFVGRRICVDAYELAQHLLATEAVPTEAFCKQLRRLDRSPRSMKDALQGEQIFLLDSFQRHGTGPDADGKYTLEISSFDLNTQQETKVKLAHHTPSELASELERCFERLRKEARLSFADWSKAEPSPVLSKIYANTRASERLRRIRDAERAGFRAILAIHAHKAKHGDWPTDLKSLKTESKRNMSDPFSDGLLRYELRSGKPLVYSLGPDGKDNGGKPIPDGKLDAEGDLVFWPKD